MILSARKEIQLAGKYVELSNGHDLESLFCMFDEKAIYRSNYVGAFEGLGEITEMMRSFFARYGDVRWEVREYRPSPKGGIEFEFIRHACDAETGEQTTGSGKERIVFNDAGLISEIEVETG